MSGSELEFYNVELLGLHSRDSFTLLECEGSI